MNNQLISDQLPNISSRFYSYKQIDEYLLGYTKSKLNYILSNPLYGNKLNFKPNDHLDKLLELNND